MDTNEVSRLLVELSPVDLETETWEREGVAYLRMSSKSSTRRIPRFAVVSSPGDFWFEVAVNENFAYTQFDEGMNRDAVREILAKLIAIGRSFVLGGARAVGSHRFFPRLIVDVNGSTARLARSLVDDVRHVFSPRVPDFRLLDGEWQ